MKRFLASRLTCARPTSRRKRSVARFTAALPLSVSLAGRRAATRMAAVRGGVALAGRGGGPRRAAAGGGGGAPPAAAGGGGQLRGGARCGRHGPAARTSTSTSRIEARAIDGHSSLPRMLEKLTVDGA